MRRSLIVTLVDGSGAPAATAYLDRPSLRGMLAEATVKGRACHSGQPDQLNLVLLIRNAIKIELNGSRSLSQPGCCTRLTKALVRTTRMLVVTNSLASAPLTG
jgi:hypothetical protein